MRTREAAVMILLQAISLGNTLSLSGTITKTFNSPPNTTPPTWENGTTSDDATTATAPYDIDNTTGGTNDGAELDSDSDGNDADDSFTFSYAGAPPSTDLVTAGDWGFNSSVSGANVYSAEIRDTNNEQVKEFEYTGTYALWYEYIYASENTVISGTAVDGSLTYTFDNVSLSQGWNKVISKTSDGSTYTYTGGTISGAVWTFMD